MHMSSFHQSIIVPYNIATLYLMHALQHIGKCIINTWVKSYSAYSESMSADRRSPVNKYAVSNHMTLQQGIYV